MDATGKYICEAEVEKCPSSNTTQLILMCWWTNMVQDTFRMYEMFCGPRTKPWDTKGNSYATAPKKSYMSVLYRCKSCNKCTWQQVWNDESSLQMQSSTCTRPLKKIERIQRTFPYNTAAFMTAVNEMADASVLRKLCLSLPLIILPSPYAPHITEELWSLLGCEGSILNAALSNWKKNI
jgi:leucyl-tRNA synthetase